VLATIQLSLTCRSTNIPKGGKSGSGSWGVLVGWFFYASNWKLYSWRGQNGAVYSTLGGRGGVALKSGDVVEVNYDVGATTISFSVNGANMGVAYTGVVGELFPCVDIYEGGTSVQML